MFCPLAQVKVDWIFPPSLICYLLWPSLAFCTVNDGRLQLNHYDEPDQIIAQAEKPYLLRLCC